jgi:hypothetical protein
MAADNKVDLALKEIGFTDDLRVKVSDGVIVCIPKQRISRPERHGIKTELVIEEEITR